MGYTLDQKLVLAKGQAISDQDKATIQAAIDLIKRLKEENKELRENKL